MKITQEFLKGYQFDYSKAEEVLEEVLDFCASRGKFLNNFINISFGVFLGCLSDKTFYIAIRQALHSNNLTQMWDIMISANSLGTVCLLFGAFLWPLYYFKFVLPTIYIKNILTQIKKKNKDIHKETMDKINHIPRLEEKLDKILQIQQETENSESSESLRNNRFN